jgi:putative ABC transport system ATP-binding protein
MSFPALEARRVSKVYRRGAGVTVHALREVSLTVPRGGYCVLSGPSGSGKSTLLALLGALETPTSGEIYVLGRSLREASEAERARIRGRAGFIFQQFHLLPRLPLWENVSYPLIPRGVSPRDRYVRAEKLLEEFGLGGRARSRPEELSGGEQQRVALARAVVGEPEVILADEPTSNLDPAAASLVMEHLHRLHARGVAILLATHDPTAAPPGAAVHQLREGRLGPGR